MSDPLFYNVSHGGQGIILKGESHPRYGKTIPEGHRKALMKSSRFKGHKHTIESKNKIREKHIGCNNFFFGKKHSKKTLKILSEKAKIRYSKSHPMKGRKQSKESIEKNINSQPKRISLIYEGIYYPSMSKLCQYLDCSGDKIRNLIQKGIVKRI